jgi:LPXTG-motif cell wall-anchored protein
MMFISYILLTAALLAQVSSASGADAELIGLIKEARQASAMVAYLEPSVLPPRTGDVQRRALKPIRAFGGIFEGEAAFSEGRQNELLLWIKEPSISPRTALEVFDKIASSLKSELGQGRIVANIPNYGDAADVKSTAVLWLVGTDIVLLRLDLYPSRGGIEVARRHSEGWRNSMGADESDFWVRTLNSGANDESGEDTEAQQVPSKTTNSPITNHLSPKNGPRVKPLSTPIEETASSPPWSIIIGLIVAALGLLWFRIKRRS